jgi:1-acyl-sn-glycerol-3-phosphate acyltransferase
MGDISYAIVKGICFPIYFITSRTHALHPERIVRPGAFILAPNHLSPYDVPLLIGSSRRHLDFLSTIEMLRSPFVAWLFRRMNCEFVDRRRADASTARALARKLELGRAVAMFPESGIRPEESSVIHGGRFKPGVIRLAQLSGAPIIPCVVYGTKAYDGFLSWLPLRRVRLDIAFGEPIEVPQEPDPHAARERATELLRQAYLDLFAEISAVRNATVKTETSRQ